MPRLIGSSPTPLVHPGGSEQTEFPHQKIMNARFLNLRKAGLLLFIALVGMTLSPARADEEDDLIAVLKSTAGTAQKCDACEKLRLAGTVRSVPALAALLSEEPTAQAARYALEGMPFPEAVAALR